MDCFSSSEDDNDPNALYIYDLIKHINDPEYPQTLEELNVISPSSIKTSPDLKNVSISFIPTTPHCRMCVLIGLAILTRLQLALAPSTKISVQVEPGTHKDVDAINKQLSDKERVAAAMENSRLHSAVCKCLANEDKYNILERDIVSEQSFTDDQIAFF